MDCHLETTEEPYSRLIGLRVFKCPLGHRSYGYRVSVSVIECRRSVAGDTWHFARTCSQWPNDNFVSVGYLPPKAIVCNECFPKAVDDSLPNSLQRARDQSASNIPITRPAINRAAIRAPQPNHKPNTSTEGNRPALIKRHAPLSTALCMVICAMC